MKKAIVPLCIITVILIVILVKSMGNDSRGIRIKKNRQSENLVGNNTAHSNEEGEVTIIGSPDTDVPKENEYGNRMELAKLMCKHSVKYTCYTL